MDKELQQAIEDGRQQTYRPTEEQLAQQERVAQELAQLQQIRAMGAIAHQLRSVDAGRKLTSKARKFRLTIDQGA